MKTGKLYHWTTKKSFKRIMIDGLHKWSFVCRRPEDWRGEICLEISGLSIDWRKRKGHASWQAITHRKIIPKKIKRVIQYNP